MPYQTGSGPSILDVWYSPDVFINNVQAALWLEPLPSPNSASGEPSRVSLSPAQEAAVVASASAATSKEEQDAGLAGKGEVPHEGPLSLTSPDPRGPISSDLFTALGQTLDSCLTESNSGLWKETGSNTRIQACYKSVGFNISNDKTTPWCAAFAGSILKRIGAPALKTLSSLAYSGYGTSVGLDPRNWRLNDIIIFTRNGGGHIGFFRGYNPANGSISVLGGNQGDNLKLSNFKNPSSSMPVSQVRRAWSIPAQYDRVVTYSGSGSGSVKVV